ncbi:MAG: AEC family transporter [Angelakisella sp.]
MAAFTTTASIVLPTFLIIAAGYLLRLTGIVDDDGCRKMNTVAFKVLIPTMVFSSIYRSNPASITNVKLIAFAAVSITVTFGLLMAVIPLLERDNARRGVMVQGIFRSSFVVLGLGLVTTMYPNGDLGATAMLSAVVAPLFNAYAVIALEVYHREDENQRIDMKRIAMGIVTNPLIIGSLLAIGLLLLGLRLPAVLEQAVEDVASAATPLALLVAGASFRFGNIGDRKRQLAISCFGRLVAVPLLLVPVAILLGFRGVELLTLLVLFAAPNAVSSHIMASNSGGDDQLAGQIVVFSTCFSIFSLFGFLYVLLSMGLL